MRCWPLPGKMNPAGVRLTLAFESATRPVANWGGIGPHIEGVGPGRLRQQMADMARPCWV